MHKKNYVGPAVGIAIFAFIVAGVYWPRDTRNEQTPKPVAVDKVACGSVVLPEAITQFAASGPNGFVTIPLDKGVGRLPVGKYNVGAWQMQSTDDQGNTWTLTGRTYGTKGSFEITAEGRTELDVGEPVVATVYGTKVAPKYYSFTQSLQGRLEEDISLVRNGTRPSAPKLRIKNKDGTYDRTFPFQYG